MIEHSNPILSSIYSKHIDNEYFSMIQDETLEALETFETHRKYGYSISDLYDELCNKLFIVPKKEPNDYINYIETIKEAKNSVYEKWMNIVNEIHQLVDKDEIEWATYDAKVIYTRYKVIENYVNNLC